MLVVTSGKQGWLGLKRLTATLLVKIIAKSTTNNKKMYVEQAAAMYLMTQPCSVDSQRQVVVNRS